MEITRSSLASQKETVIAPTRSEGLHNPAFPTYILRGHVSAIHALRFFASNTYLASADSDGWLVIWSLASKRAAAVWKAHNGGILGIKNWGDETLITHGRDHKLRVWQLRQADLENLDVKLPIEGAVEADQKQPWLLHALDVNALNFCAFAMCYDQSVTVEPPETKSGDKQEMPDGEIKEGTDKPLVVAAPNALDSGGIDIFQLPSGTRVSKIYSDKSTTTGMVMTIQIFFHPKTGKLMVISGYEDGQTMVHVRRSQTSPSDTWSWDKVLLSKPHIQPVLSLTLDPQKRFYVTSSADANIAKFLIPDFLVSKDWSNVPAKVTNTKHAGQQGLSMRSDGKIFATAGWDARVRVYSAKTMKELAVLKWHKDGCFATAFAYIIEEDTTPFPSDSESGQAKKRNALDIIKEKRSSKAQRTHWLAAGGKDGKMSLWEIY